MRASRSIRRRQPARQRLPALRARRTGRLRRAGRVGRSIRDNRDTSDRAAIPEGDGQIRFWTTDLTAEYVRLNADYHT